MEPKVWLAGFCIVGCTIMDLSCLERSELEQKVDALGYLIRGEVYLLNEKMKRDREERAEIMKSLNKTLASLLNMNGETTNQSQSQIHELSAEKNNELLLSNIEKNNKAIKEISETLKRTKRGIMAEKAARKSDTNSLTTQLIKLEKNQNVIINKLDAYDEMRSDLNMIKISQDDLADKIRESLIIIHHLKDNSEANQNEQLNLIINGTNILQRITNELKDKTKMLETKLDVQGSVYASYFNSSQLKTDYKLDVLLQQVDNVSLASDFIAAALIRADDIPYLRQCDKRDLGACLESQVSTMFGYLNSVADFHVTLVGGTNEYEGRVEIEYRGRKGTVCDDKWDAKDAQVVCSMMGYFGGTAFPGPGSSNGHGFGEGTGEIILDNVECKGNERSLFLCHHADIGVHNCGHSEDAGVRCIK